MTTVILQRPSWSRYRRLFFDGDDKSLLRCLEYEKLATLGLTGKALDFGGGQRTNYTAQIPKWGDPESGFTYESANIDPKTEPTYLIEPGAPLPIGDESFDHVLSFNTFEHIYDLDGVLREVGRVLKPAGQLVFVAPFMFRVHGHPDDYTRGTASFWVRKLSEHGFQSAEIEALTWGPFSTAQTVSGIPGPFKSLRRHAGLLLDFLYAHRRTRRTTVVAAAQDDPLCASPLAYFVRATRQ